MMVPEGIYQTRMRARSLEKKGISKGTGNAAPGVTLAFHDGTFRFALQARTG
jgi:hypothetical protein